MTRILTKSLILATAMTSAAAWAQPSGKGHGRQSSGSGRPVIGASPITAPGGYGPSRGSMPPGYPGSASPYMSGTPYGKPGRGGSSPVPSSPYPSYGPGSPGPMPAPYSSPKSGKSRQPAEGYGYPVMPQGMGMPYGAPGMAEYPSAVPSRDSRSRGTKGSAGYEPRSRQSLRAVETAPGMDSMVRPAEGSYFAPGQRPSDLQKQFRSSSDSLKNAMSQGDQERISEQLYGLRHEAQTLRGRLRTLPLEQRLHVPSISLMYDEGTRLVEEGMRTGQESKVRMGMDKIEDANRRLGELEKQ